MHPRRVSAPVGPGVAHHIHKCVQNRRIAIGAQAGIAQVGAFADVAETLGVKGCHILFVAQQKGCIGQSTVGGGSCRVGFEPQNLGICFPNPFQIDHQNVGLKQVFSGSIAGIPRRIAHEPVPFGPVRI